LKQAKLEDAIADMNALSAEFQKAKVALKLSKRKWKRYDLGRRW
jgi:hypothetical protein